MRSMETDLEAFEANLKKQNAKFACCGAFFNIFCIAILYTIVTSQQLQIDAILKNQGDFSDQGYIDMKAQNAANIKTLFSDVKGIQSNMTNFTGEFGNI